MADAFTRIQVRRGTEQTFIDADPVLAAGEPSFTLDSNILKMGDGSKSWTELADYPAKSAQALSLGSATYSNWLPSKNADLIRVTSITSDTIVNGVDSSFAKKQLIVINADATTPNSITFSHNSSSASAANKIYCVPSSDITLRYGESIVLTYDNDVSKWIGFKIGSTSNPMVTLSQADYDARVAANNVDANTIYIVT
jgi:hypothetical protein